jgi:hypothetical protein
MLAYLAVRIDTMEAKKVVIGQLEVVDILLIGVHHWNEPDISIIGE